MRVPFSATAAVLFAGLFVACQNQNDIVSSPEAQPVASSTATERPGSVPDPVSGSNRETATTAFTTLQTEILTYVNQARSASCKCGTTTYPAAPALVLNAQLNTAATKHATDMATFNYFSHTGRDGSTPWARMTREGYVWRRAGENIAAGYATPRAVVDGWLRSPGHCANLMNSNFKDLGAGYAYGASSTYKRYWVQNFGAK
jgi:uncharacterized protein YkwD